MLVHDLVVAATLVAFADFGKACLKEFLIIVTFTNLRTPAAVLFYANLSAVHNTEQCLQSKQGVC